MNRKVSVILLCVAAALTVLSVLLSQMQSSGAAVVGRIFKFRASEITGMEIYRGEKLTASFEQDARKNWKVTVPQLQINRHAADRVVIEEMLAFVARAEIIPAQGVDYTQSGIDAAEVPQFVVRFGSGKAASVYLGNYSADSRLRYLSSDADKKQVLAVDRELTGVFDRDLRTYRSLDVVDFSASPPQKITVYPGSGAQPLVLAGSDLGWVIEQPVSWPADNKAVGRFLRVLSMLRAKDVTSHEMRIDGNTPWIELQSARGTQKIWIEGAPGDGVAFLKSSDRDEIYEVSGSVVWEFLRGRPEHYRLRVLDLLRENKAASLELTGAEGEKLALRRQESGWTAGGDFNFQVEKDAADNLNNLLTGIVIKDVVSESGDNPASFGLDKPRLTILAFDAAGAQVAGVTLATVALAAPLSGADKIYARFSGRRQIVELDPICGGFLLQDFSYYRWRVVHFTDFREIARVAIVTPAFTREYWRNTDTQFQQVRPETRLLSEKGNWDFLSLVRKLARLKGEGYIPEKNAQKMDFGLDQPTLKTILTMRLAADSKNKPAQTLTLLIGKSLSVPDLSSSTGSRICYYARLENSKTVFIIDKKLVDELFIEYK